MVIIDFIKTYPQDSIVILVVLISLIALVITSKTSELKETALYLVSTAETEWSSGTGQIKFSQVYSELKKRMPIVTIFLSKKVLSDIIEAALVRMKEILKK